MRVAVIVNSKSDVNVLFAASIIDYLIKKDIDIFANDKQNAFFSNSIADVDFRNIDWAVVLGGDGTILTVARELAPLDIPLLGINMGRVGFLCQAEKDDAFSAIDKILQSDYILDKRFMLRCDVKRDGIVVASFTALNDIVVNYGRQVRTLNYKLTVNDQIVNSYQADGVIIATPTGSTGYSFSAGGPIVTPDADVVIITPICSHSFFSRPIVTSAKSKICVICYNNTEAANLTTDGQRQYDIYDGDEVIIRIADIEAKMIRFKNRNYFDKLHKKLCNYE